MLPLAPTGKDPEKQKTFDGSTKRPIEGFHNPSLSLILSTCERVKTVVPFS